MTDAAMSLCLFFFGNRWMKLNSKAGRKEKERGELQVTVQFTRNNMTASMFDLTIKDKPRSAFGKLKDRSHRQEARRRGVLLLPFCQVATLRCRVTWDSPLKRVVEWS